MKIIIVFTLLLGIVSSSFGENDITESVESTQEAKIEIFTFPSDGTDINGKIYLPASFNKDKNLHSIFLIDFTEQHFRVAKDEFEKVISATEQIQNFDAVVVTLEEHLDVDANPGVFEKYYDIYKDMTSYVDVNYTNNISRTFIGRGSEAGLVLMTLFLEDSITSLFENFIGTDSPSSFNSYIIKTLNGENFPPNKGNKKLHFSFSTSNDRSSCTNLINKINQVQYPWLQFESKEYAFSNYENTYPDAFTEGLKYVFDDIATGIEDNSSTVPTGYRLEQNYPNPFNPSTKIKYTIPEKVKSEKANVKSVTLKIFDLLGREVVTLVNESQRPGSYEVGFDASLLSNGIYLYSLQTNDFIQTKKMILMK